MNEIFEKLMQINRIVFSKPYFKLINMGNLLMILQPQSMRKNCSRNRAPNRHILEILLTRR